MPPRAIATTALLLATMALGGCSTTTSSPDGAPTTGVAGVSDRKTPEPEAGPWDDYGLPAPGSEGTGVTVSRVKVRLVDRSNLDALSTAQVDALMASLTELYDQAYWRVENLPETGPEQHRYDEYLSPAMARFYNNAVKEHGSVTFGLYTGERDAFYQHKTYDIQVVALDSYPNSDVSGAGPVAHVRTYYKQSYVGLPTKRGHSKDEPAGPAASYVLQGKVDGWFSNIDQDPFVELISWADSDIDVEKTKLEKTG